jgi:general stress protein YciG
MDRARQREIAAKGGRAAHAKGTAHVWSPEEARAAGRKGGETVSKDRSHMSAIGREGGESRSAAVRAARLRRAQEQAAVQAGAKPVEREVALPNGRDHAPLADRLPVRAERPAERPSERPRGSLGSSQPSLQQGGMA